MNEIKTSKFHLKTGLPLAAHFHPHSFEHLKIYKSNRNLFFFSQEDGKKNKKKRLDAVFFSFREHICTATRTPLWFRHRSSHLRDIINLVGFTGESEKKKQNKHPVKLAASLYTPIQCKGGTQKSEHKILQSVLERKEERRKERKERGQSTTVQAWDIIWSKELKASTHLQR